ncbi:HD family phosphohydrolase [Clostridium sulfidigenes]|uniref:HD family phosphohydrolase n=1 Tax=Clostridium sulfidigenes TaxID=318464 RepID=UPI000A03FA8B|nr:HDIG domain-containing metalloprotein [Clostridium sulfidigenes]
MGHKKRLSRIRFPRVKPYITFIITTLIVYLILSTVVVSKKYKFQVGEIAKFDIKAPRDVEDKVATQKSIEEELKHVQETYTYDANIRKGALDNINKLFELVKKINSENPPYNPSSEDDNEKIKSEQDKINGIKLKKLKEESVIKNLSTENYGLLLSLNDTGLNSLNEEIVECMNNLYDTTPIYENKPQDIVSAQGYITAFFNNTSYAKNVKDLAMAIGYSQTKATYFIDHEKTEEARQNITKNVTPVIYKKDQTIIAEGQPITESQIELLNDLGLLDNDKSTGIYMNLVLLLVVAGVLGLQWRYIKEKRRDIYEDNSKVILINLLTVLTVVLARISILISPYVIPFACISILLSVLIDSKTSVTIGILNVIFISFIVKFSVDLTLIAMVNAVIVPMVLKRVQQRNDILYSSLLIGAINVVFTGAMGYFLSTNVTSIINKAMLTGVSAIVSGILAIGILPVLENIFDVLTNIKLLELANPNHPLMRRLLLEAPGTYHHCVLVANLAEMAAESVGANPILARVASYYHDVGKLERPYYFKENQIGIANPHDDMSPAMSSAIILSHVEDGVKLAEKYNLPEGITDVVREHHGDSLAKYFYITMRNKSENPDEVNEADYRYGGPPPRTKESTIIMLADGVEASVRSINKPNKKKIEEMVNNIIKSRIDENQFVNSDLTFKDLEKIRESFLKVLSGIYHERIEYPKDKINLTKENNEKKLEEDKEVVSTKEEQFKLKEPEAVIQTKEVEKEKQI